MVNRKLELQQKKLNETIGQLKQDFEKKILEGIIDGSALKSIQAVYVDNVYKLEISPENQVTSKSRIKSPSFEGSMPWQVFR